MAAMFLALEDLHVTGVDLEDKVKVATEMLGLQGGGGGSGGAQSLPCWATTQRTAVKWLRSVDYR